MPASKSSKPAKTSKPKSAAKPRKSTVVRKLTEAPKAEPSVKSQPLSNAAATTSPKSAFPFKLIILGFGALLFIVVAVLVAGGIYASKSNKNVPVFSSVVELAEKTFTSKNSYAKSKQQEVFDSFLAGIKPAVKKDSDAGKYIATQLSAKREQELTASQKNVDTATYNSTLTVSSKGDGKSSSASDFSLEVTANGGVRKQDFKADINAEATVSMGGTGSSRSIGFELLTSVRKVGSKLYLKLDQIPALLSGFIDLSSIQGKWLSTDMEETKDMASGLVPGMPSTDTTDGATITEKQLKVIHDIIMSKELSSAITRIPDETFGDVRATCTQVKLNKSQLKFIIDKLGELDEAENSSMLTANDLEGFNSLTLQTCEGRVDGLMYRLGVRLDADSKTDESTSNILADLTIKMNDYGKPVAIEEPTDAEDMEAAFQRILGPILQQQIQKQLGPSATVEFD